MSKDSLETTRILPRMCSRVGLEKKVVNVKAKKLLQSKQDIGWVATEYCNPDDDYIYYFRTDEFRKALTWIQDYFYIDNDKNEEEYMLILWESGLMKKLFQESMDKLSSFQKVGCMYHVLIEKKYLDENPMSEKEIEDLLDISRSTYYTRMQEAVVAFGLAFCSVAKAYSLEEENTNAEE